MKIGAWRIVKAAHAASAFSGAGAREYGGRWNSAGVAVVYAGSTMSLAALEILVHLTPPVELRYVAFRVEFDEALVARVAGRALPRAWRAEPPAPSSQAVGDNWARMGRTAVLELPSVLIPAERNYLLNPAHCDFAKIVIARPVPFAFDPRLVG